jgi:predicted Kef-type K+ transport protein
MARNPTRSGEFSFILVQTARKAGIVGGEVYNATLAASLISILLNVALVRCVPASLHRWRLAKQTAVQSEQDLRFERGRVARSRRTVWIWTCGQRDWGGS